MTETYTVIDPDGNELERVTLPHVYPYPYNVIMSKAADRLPAGGNSGLLFICDGKGNTITRVTGWKSASSFLPIEARQ